MGMVVKQKGKCNNIDLAAVVAAAAAEVGCMMDRSSLQPDPGRLVVTTSHSVSHTV